MLKIGGNKVKCEIIAVGTELLLGCILNTNAQYLSEKMAELGIDVHFQTVVGDNLERVKGALKAGLQRADIIITSGGLGPTDDDLTKEAVSEALGLKLLPHEPSLTKLKEFFKKINRPMDECNLKQGYLPEDCIILNNNNGTAPGVMLDKDNKIIVLLPGPPKELIPMFEDSVYEYLRKKSNSLLKSRTLRIVGIGESNIQGILKDVFDSQTNPTIAPYAKSGEVHLRITAKSSSLEEADRLIEGLEKTVRERLEGNIYGTDYETLEGVVNKLLTEGGLTISCAESCTGGLLSQRLTSVPGASKCFMNSIITYSNESKEEFLGVKHSTLEKHGAVSEETALEMAEGIRRVSGTDVGISITGIAGPDGGTEEKPVGLVYIGISCMGATEVHKCLFTGGRDKIRYNTSTKALDIIRRILLKKM